MVANLLEALEDMMEGWLEGEVTTFTQACIVMGHGEVHNRVFVCTIVVFVGIAHFIHAVFR